MLRETDEGVYEDTGVAFGPDFTGRGYGAQVLAALADDVRANGGKTMILSCRRENTASRKLILKCGFAFSHEEDRTDPRDGSPYILEFYERHL